jgi:hypothetical protein
VTSVVSANKSGGKVHVDTVDAGTCSEPSGPSSPGPSSPGPSSPGPSDPGPADCGTAPAWKWESVYLGGAVVKHNGKLWKANWWTQGSEPGLTAQWSTIGTC